MKTDNRHKEKTKKLQEFINVIRDFHGYEPLYLYSHEGETKTPNRKPRNRSKKKEISL
jgi:hypothetical protein